MSFRQLLGRVHRDERGAVSLESVLLLGAIALPILIVIVKFGWPRVRDFFYRGLEDLEGETNRAIQGG